MDNASADSRPGQTGFNALLIVAFSVILMSGLLGTVFHWDFYEARENRHLSELPVLSQTAINEWPAALEDWVNDHFGFRNTYIRRHRKIMRKIEKSNQVVYGRDGWLFFNTPEVIQDYLGRRQPDQEACRGIASALNSRIGWCSKQNITYLFVLVPNKITVYPEYLSKQLSRLKGRSYRQTLMDYFNDRFENNLIDLTPWMMNAKTSAPLYLKTDTHWNDRGAAIATATVIEHLRPGFPGLPAARPIQEMEIRIVPFTGDLASMSGTPEKYPPFERERLLDPDRCTWTTNELKEAVFLKPENLPLNHHPPHTVHNPSGHGNLVIFHDSFTEGLQDYLPHYFENTTYIWRYSTPELMQAAVETCSPDIIIEQAVERFLVGKGYRALSTEIHPVGEVTHGL